MKEHDASHVGLSGEEGVAALRKEYKNLCTKYHREFLLTIEALLLEHKALYYSHSGVVELTIDLKG